MKVWTDLQAKLTGPTLEVHQLIRYTSTAVGTGLITGWETKILLLQGQKTKEKKENFLNQIKMKMQYTNLKQLYGKSNNNNKSLVRLTEKLKSNYSAYLLLRVCAFSHVRLCGLMNCSPSGSSVHGIFLGKNIGMGCHVLLQRIFLTLGLNCVSCVSCIGRQILYHQHHLGSPSIVMLNRYFYSSNVLSILLVSIIYK